MDMVVTDIGLQQISTDLFKIPGSKKVCKLVLEKLTFQSMDISSGSKGRLNCIIYEYYQKNRPQ
ncbi:hypothetical protein F7984_15270 [Pradoshia sp. D12]|uniref:hypothetical protein n=1 Tax=Bacillaceae TaxID=186817 RepID=UPI001120620E|nr:MULTISPECIES: hypothetical protein [Bacillaceae]QFK72510.1 hypothetical protein F7984_15270 [Pradoshia sp. D12]TPF70746.1 hypothetical protein FHY44_15950 [Bacillus sp. D12]